MREYTLRYMDRTKNNGVTTFQFYADNFALAKDHARSLCYENHYIYLSVARVYK